MSNHNFDNLILLTAAVFLAFPVCHAQNSPARYALRDNDSLFEQSLTTNIVAEIKTMGDSMTWFGTGRGLALHDGQSVFMHKTTSDSINNLDSTLFLPAGGVPAIGVLGDSMLVAFSGDDGNIQVGLGLALSLSVDDSTTMKWNYFSQPTDNESDSLELTGGVGYFRKLPVTVPQANVTYDISLNKDYFWVASWAGGLRNYHFSRNEWRHIPLPLDSQSELDLCDENNFNTKEGPYILNDYFLNPRDPADGGNHNHKAFSVLVYGDTVWVGTANGLNRGLIVRDTLWGQNAIECIRWKHYYYPENGLSGNFVVGLAKQFWRGQITIWAATVNADDPGEVRGLSYSRDGGSTWEATLLGERVYNISSKDSLVFVSAASGLWKSLDGVNWARFKSAVDQTIFSQKQILSDVVYTVAIDDRGDSLKFWIGTPDGVAISGDMHGSSWSILQADYDKDQVYAYPNPFSPLTHNQLDGNGYVRFHTGALGGNKLTLDVFSFSMEKVHHQDYKLNSYRGAIKWDGRGQDGKPVANGVYFARLKFSSKDGQPASQKWTKLIVVK
tara:strand:+ start:2874 stop:4541 length:1668 start_codon:yes stop_codon:yes gene_type:complete